MDADRFDVVVRSLAAVSRRSTLDGIAAGLAALLGRLAIDDASARKKRRKRNKKTCKGGKKKCGSKCIPKANCCTDADCGECERCQSGACIPGCQSGQLCQNGACTCPTGQRDCQGTCIPDGDCCVNADCGNGAACVDRACLCLAGFRPCQELCIPDEVCCNDADCPDFTNCQEGVCICPVAGQVACDESCADLATDGANCGACGNVCASGGCVHGACTCEAGIDCPRLACGFCGDRGQGGKACLLSFGVESCDTDDDCPLGSFCGVTQAGPRCSVPCAR